MTKKPKARKRVANVDVGPTPVSVTANAVSVEIPSQRRKGVLVSKMREFASVAPFGTNPNEVESS